MVSGRADRSEGGDMGVNNRARRAAKKRKRQGGRGGGDGAGGHGGGEGGYGGPFDAPYGAPFDAFGPTGNDPGGSDERQVARAVLWAALDDCRSDLSAAGHYAREFTGADPPVPLEVMLEAVDLALVTSLAAVLGCGWGPVDLGEIARRRLSLQHLPVLASRLATETARHPGHLVTDAWRAELAALGPADALDPRTTAGLELALGLTVVLGTLPAVERLIAPPGVADETPLAATGADAKKLARVRALLAKAESTEFPEEAEALSAKAQELISQFALDRLVAAADAPSGSATQVIPVAARRLWLDAPYLLPKAMLVHAVAEANRCSSVVTEHLGFCTVVGAPADLEAVELLTTSLLVQSSSAMLRAGRHTERDGTSRTRSFRRSFLVSYAARIGERLVLADQEVARGSERAGQLVRLMRAHEKKVAAAFSEMFPAAVGRATTVSNMTGWAEGRAAADLARLDTRAQVNDQAG